MLRQGREPEVPGQLVQADTGRCSVQWASKFTADCPAAGAGACSSVPAVPGSSRARGGAYLRLACREMPVEAASLMMAISFLPFMKASFSFMLTIFCASSSLRICRRQHSKQAMSSRLAEQAIAEASHQLVEQMQL
jgi:hypothetical protein